MGAMLARDVFISGEGCKAQISYVKITWQLPYTESLTFSGFEKSGVIEDNTRISTSRIMKCL